MNLEAENVTFIGNGTSYNIFKNINSNANSLIHAFESSIIEFPIHYPYLDLTSTLITSVINFNYVSALNCYSGA